MTDDTTNNETAIETKETSLTIRRTFDASRERVFRAFTDPNDVEEWQSVGEVTAEVHTLEPEPDGALSVSHFHGEDRYDIEGTFVEVDENERLVYTWQMVKGMSEDEESLITINFREVDEGTEVVFTHEQVVPEMVEGTAAGWKGMLKNLETVLQG